METTIVTGVRRNGVRAAAQPAFVMPALRPRPARTVSGAALRRRGFVPGTAGVTAPTTDPTLDVTLVRTS
ncbi:MULTISPECIES: hypothetical protein [unclassified Ornithinimicrobium]|uniref:hypothetical protein n=1 Tax=unclassified Ornithinimicrobium TaxID=2615080 RepID=UPI0038554440